MMNVMNEHCWVVVLLTESSCSIPRNLKPPAADLPISFFLIFIEKKSYLKLLFLGMRMFFVEWVEVKLRSTQLALRAHTKPSPGFIPGQIRCAKLCWCHGTSAEHRERLERSWKILKEGQIWQCVKTLYPFCSHQNSWVKMDVHPPKNGIFIGIDP